MDDQVSVRSWDCVRQQLTAESELVVTPKQKKNKFRLDGSDDCSTPPTEYRKFSAFKSAEVDREEEGERKRGRGRGELDRGRGEEGQGRGEGGGGKGERGSCCDVRKLLVVVLRSDLSYQ